MTVKGRHTMSTQSPQFIDVDGRRIATLVDPGPAAGATGLFWLPGFKSDMTSTKATALADFARGRYGCNRFDYSGHGLSGGAFEDCTIGDWLAEAEAVFTGLTAGPQIVIGSSMGGYIALLLLRRMMASAPDHARRIAALVLIAPAVDMTETLMWEAFSPAQKAALLAQGYYLRPSTYGEPYKITRRLIEEGRTHLIGSAPFDPGRPVHIFQGLLDDAVPPAHTQRLLALLTGGHVTLEEIADGDHRLSRPEDVARLCEVITALASDHPRE
jgi:pimeloyl-ACP methyl ester carboxylesterase